MNRFNRSTSIHFPIASLELFSSPNTAQTSTARKQNLTSCPPSTLPSFPAANSPKLPSGSCKFRIQSSVSLLRTRLKSSPRIASAASAKYVPATLAGSQHAFSGVAYCGPKSVPGNDRNPPPGCWQLYMNEM